MWGSHCNFKIIYLFQVFEFLQFIQIAIYLFIYSFICLFISFSRPAFVLLLVLVLLLLLFILIPNIANGNCKTLEK